MHEISPRKGCTDRHTACHGTCQVYTEWLDRFHAQQKHFEANKNRWGGVWTARGEKAYNKQLKYGSGTYKGGRQ